MYTAVSSITFTLESLYLEKSMPSTKDSNASASLITSVSSSLKVLSIFSETVHITEGSYPASVELMLLNSFGDMFSHGVIRRTNA